ncbi:MAG: MFS transporter [bacterium]
MTLKNNNSDYLKLGTMMFFQYMMFAVWWVPLAAYLANLGVSRNLTALILSSMAFGSVVSPMVGMLADRYFRAQHLLAFSNFAIAILLLLAALTSHPEALFVLLVAAMLFYMPTWALTSSIAMHHIGSDNFSRIRVFGTVGWIAAGIFSVINSGWMGIDFDGTHLPFYYGAALSLTASLFNLTLPDTPPGDKGTKASLIDIMGFRSISMLRHRDYAIFLSIFIFSMIPFTMYWSYFSEYLADRGYRFITITMSTGQILEIFILLSVPFLIRKAGLRNTMMLGLIAMVIRYLALYLAGDDAGLHFVLTGAGVHGMIFGYYHLGAQIYTDRKAPDGLKSQAQGLIFFITFAVGLLIGNFVCGWIISQFSSPGPEGTIYQWKSIWGITFMMSVVALLAYLSLFREKQQKTKG